MDYEKRKAARRNRRNTIIYDTVLCLAGVGCVSILYIITVGIGRLCGVI